MKNEIAIILSAQRAQIANPARACVNSESAFVADRIRNEGHSDVAKRYWSYVCSHFDTDAMRFGWEVYDLQTQLNQIDKGWTMPEWGYKGT